MREQAKEAYFSLEHPCLPSGHIFKLLQKSASSSFFVDYYTMSAVQSLGAEIHKGVAQLQALLTAASHSYDIRRTLRQIDRCIDALDQEIKHDDEKESYQQGDNRAPHLLLTPTLVNDLMLLVTLDMDHDTTWRALEQEDLKSISELAMALIPTMTRLLHDAGTLPDNHVMTLLQRIVEMLQPERPTEAIVLLGMLELLNANLSASRLAELASTVECLYMLQLLLPECVPALQQQQEQRDNDENNTNKAEDSVWLQLRVWTGTLLECLAQILQEKEQSLEFWLQPTLVQLRGSYPSPEALRQEIQAFGDLVRNYMIESVEFALQALSRQSNDENPMHTEEARGMLRHASLAANTLLLQDSFALDSHRGLCKSLWRALAAFVTIGCRQLDDCLQLAAINILWKLTQHVVAQSQVGGAVCLDAADAALVATTILKLIEHADYFWNSSVQQWIEGLLTAPVDGSPPDEGTQIIRHALQAAALTVLFLPTSESIQYDKIRSLLQVALSGADTEKDPWHGFFERQVSDYSNEMSASASQM
jgi:hypothetical protein